MTIPNINLRELRSVEVDVSNTDRIPVNIPRPNLNIPQVPQIPPPPAIPPIPNLNREIPSGASILSSALASLRTRVPSFKLPVNMPTFNMSRPEWKGPPKIQPPSFEPVRTVNIPSIDPSTIVDNIAGSVNTSVPQITSTLNV